MLELIWNVSDWPCWGGWCSGIAALRGLGACGSSVSRQLPVHSFHLADPHLQFTGHLTELLHRSDVLKEDPVLFTYNESTNPPSTNTQDSHSFTVLLSNNYYNYYKIHAFPGLSRTPMNNFPGPVNNNNNNPIYIAPYAELQRSPRLFEWGH